MYRKYEDGYTDFVRKQLTQKGLDKAVSVCYNTQALKGVPEYRGVEQLEARRAHNPEVVGSSPASATKEPPKSSDLGGFSTSRGHSHFAF